MIGLVLATFVALTLTYLLIRSEAGYCLADPFKSAINNFEESTNSPLSCSCFPQDKNFLPFIVTNDSIKPLQLEVRETNGVPSFDFSGLAAN